MKRWIIINEKVEELDVTYSAEVYTDESDIEGNSINGIHEVKAEIRGEGIAIDRYYLSTGQFRPMASESRLSFTENAAILDRVKLIFDEYGVA